jgi:predicted amidohydrolase YtcJ
MPLRTTLLLALLAGFAGVACASTTSSVAPATPAPADVVLVGGTVWTGVHGAPRAQALALRGDRIVAVGDDASVSALVGPATRVVQLRGRLVLPGLHDGHVHPLGAGRQERGCSLQGLSSVAALQDKIKACAAATAKTGGFVHGRGWNLSLFADANPDKKLLDAVVPDRPAYFRGEDGHSGWANSKALALAGITKTTKNPDSGVIERDASGEPSGTLRESAMDLLEALLPEPTLNDDLESLRLALSRLSEHGITSIMDAGTDERRLQTYKVLADRGELSVRVVGCTVVDPAAGVDKVMALATDLRARFSGHPLLRPTCTKIYLDGVLEGETAALLAPYDDHIGHKGSLTTTPAQLTAAVVALEREGFQVHMHVIGDAAARAALDAYEASRKAAGHPIDLRPTLAHLQLVDAADHARFAALGVLVNAQSYWAYPDTYIRDINTPQVGAARVQRMYPWGSLKKAGALVVGGSDWPVSSLSPLDAIEVMLTRQDPALDGGPVLNENERLDVDTALRAYTTTGAFLLHHEDDVGTLAPGKAADVVVFDRDLAAIPATAINQARVDLTIAAGRIVYERAPTSGMTTTGMTTTGMTTTGMTTTGMTTK